jgi:hypothetical protein
MLRFCEAICKWIYYVLLRSLIMDSLTQIVLGAACGEAVIG